MSTGVACDRFPTTFAGLSTQRYGCHLIRCLARLLPNCRSTARTAAGSCNCRMRVRSASSPDRCSIGNSTTILHESAFVHDCAYGLSRRTISRTARLRLVRLLYFSRTQRPCLAVAGGAGDSWSERWARSSGTAKCSACAPGGLHRHRLPAPVGRSAQPQGADVRARPVALRRRFRHPGAGEAGEYRVVCPTCPATA